jgi:F0F1-type ATP synthase membrane subunit c/vacuolar-type H+-ATPase subunit K
MLLFITVYLFSFYSMILLGFRYLASSIPIICFAGVAFGVGLVFASLILSLSRNPSILNSLVR